MTEPEKRPISTGMIVSVGLIALLAAAVIFLVIQNIGLKSDVDEGLESAASLEAEIQSVEKQLDEYQYLLNEKDLDVERKQQMLNERDSLIQAKDSKIASLLAKNRISQEEAERLRGKVAQLEHYVKKYQADIDVLKQEIAARDAVIDSLHTELDSTRENLTNATNTAIRTGIQLEAAKKLTVHAFTFARFKQSGTPEFETEFRSSQLDKLRICVDIEGNQAASQGKKDLYVQLFDPNGKLVMDESRSGFFKASKESKDPFRWTGYAAFDYKAEGGKACVDFPKPSGYQYSEGTYKVLAFCDDWMIGEGSFKVH